MSDLIRNVVQQVISEQNAKRKIIDTVSKTYVMIYDNSYLLNNLLTKIRVMEGVATVYQRDAIKKIGSRSKVPVEISFIPTEGAGGSNIFLEDLLSSVKALKGVVRLEKNTRTS